MRPRSIAAISACAALACAPRDVPGPVLRPELTYLAAVATLDGHQRLDVAAIDAPTRVTYRTGDTSMVVLLGVRDARLSLDPVGWAGVLAGPDHIEVLRGEDEAWSDESAGEVQRAVTGWLGAPNSACPTVALAESSTVSANAVGGSAQWDAYVAVGLQIQRWPRAGDASVVATAEVAASTVVAVAEGEVATLEGQELWRRGTRGPRRLGPKEARWYALAPTAEPGFLALTSTGAVYQATGGADPVRVPVRQAGATAIYATRLAPLLRLGERALALPGLGAGLPPIIRATADAPGGPDVVAITAAADIPNVGILAAANAVDADGTRFAVLLRFDPGSTVEDPWRWYARLDDIRDVSALVAHGDGLLIGSGRGLHFFSPASGMCPIDVGIAPIEHLVGVGPSDYLLAGRAAATPTSHRTGWLVAAE